LAFGATSDVWPGELAKDRPAPKHLPEFYLRMSFGGMLGGIFNGIVALIIFIYVWEFGIALFCACFLRPKLKEGGWADDMLTGVSEQQPAAAPAPTHKGPKGQHPPRPIVRSGANAGTALGMDFLLP